MKREKERRGMASQGGMREQIQASNMNSLASENVSFVESQHL